MRKFEMPYNFDKNLLLYYGQYKEVIDCVYLPTYYEDMKDARHSISGATQLYPQTKKEYLKHVEEILNNDLHPSLLLQHPTATISDELLKSYLDIGIRNFIVNQDKIAYQLKNINSDVKITASITKKLSLANYLTTDYSIYSDMVLFYPFNRSLRTIKKLPQNNKYILILNQNCSYKCPAMNHWFPEIEDNKNFLCPINIDDSMLIIPEALPLFDEYISKYKFHGRNFSTKEIILEFEKYVHVNEIDKNNLKEYKKQITNSTLSFKSKKIIINPNIFYNNGNHPMLRGE